MDWNLDTYTFIKSTQRGSKEEVWLAVTDMLKELFQTASDAAINCKFEQNFLSNEAPCAKREQILASVRDMLKELFQTASDAAINCKFEQNFLSNEAPCAKREQILASVRDMLKELFQTASDAAINCKFEQNFLSNEAPCAKREQILASVRELIDELFIKASHNYDWDLAPQCSSEEHKSRDVNKKCTPTPMTAFIDNNGEGQLVDTKRSEISKECQTATSAAETPRDISDIQNIIPDHPLYESEITDGQIPDQNLIIINEKSCSDLQETESQHNPNCDISKIREDMQKDSFEYLQDPVYSDKINQAATDQEEAQKDNSDEVLQGGNKSPMIHLPFLSLRDEELEVPPCKKAKLDEHPFGYSADFELNLLNDVKMLLMQTVDCVCESNEEIPVCLEDITPTQVKTNESADEDLLVSAESKTHTSLSAESVDVTLKQTLLTGEDTRMPQPTLQGCDCDNNDTINSNHDDAREEQLKTLKKITNDDVGQYLHLLENREGVKLPSGECHTLRNSDVEFDVSSLHIDDSISSQQSDEKCECDVTDEVRNHHEKITHDDVGQDLQLLKKPHEDKLPSGKCHTLEDEDAEEHASSSRAIISTEQQDEDKYTSDVADSNQEKKIEKVNRRNYQKATEIQEDLMQSLNANTGEDRGIDTDTQPINDQMVPSFQREEDSCYHGDDELYANDEEPKDVKRRRLGTETKENTQQTSPDLRELKDLQLTSEEAGLVPEYSTADRSTVVSESVSSRATGSVVQVVPQNSSTGMFHWRQDITFQSQLPKTSDSKKPNYPQGATVGPSQQRPQPLPSCNRKRRVGLSRRQRLSHLHSVSRPPCHQVKMEPSKKHED
ncbi:uncharacterized protein [Asterias amurensis]|uniref:uncharacterized protein n=1 Tax=Asterias amurensis TaxID=7602 RepID=UPI003AB41CB8